MFLLSSRAALRLIPRIALTALMLATVVVGGYGFYRLGVEQGIKTATGESESRKPLYWHDPMIPGHRFGKPGKSPFMDMQLVPVYGTDADDEGKSQHQPACSAESGRAHCRSHQGQAGAGHDGGRQRCGPVSRQ